MDGSIMKGMQKWDTLAGISKDSFAIQNFHHHRNRFYKDWIN